MFSSITPIERLADSYAICDQDLPFQLSTRFAEFASVSKHTVYVHQRRYQAAQGLVVHSHLQETIEQPKATNEYLKCFNHNVLDDKIKVYNAPHHLRMPLSANTV